MNVQDYILSGIVESYVLGLATPEERVEFERMAEQHPEVLQARQAFEIALENQAMANSVVPPADLKEQIRAAVLDVPADDRTPVVSMQRAPVVRTNWLKYAVAASVILLAGSIIWNISLYNKNSELVASNEGLKASADSAQQQLAAVQADAQKIQQNPNVKMAAMKGLPDAPNAFATVYWDTTSHDVYLLANNLPTPASDQQYQLWALLDGQPIDMGVIDNNLIISQSRLLIRAKNVQNAQAFAITLEKKGGNPTPQGKMIVLGEL